MNLEEAAKYLNIDTETLKTYCYARKIRHERKGGEFRFLKEDLDAYKGWKTYEVKNDSATQSSKSSGDSGL